MKISILVKHVIFWVMCLVTSQLRAQQFASSFCNPINLNYRFSYDSPSYREAADPVIHLFRGKYFLYASKSGGYWYSDDMLQWSFRPSATLPVEDYAPTVEAIHDTVFFIASSGAPKVYYNTNPLEDNWKVYNSRFRIGMTDPALFKDSDGRVYLYYGCSNREPIMGIELNPLRKLDTIGIPQILIGHHAKEHGWEEHGEQNQDGGEGWNEGGWMTKYNGKYYLQYASPGTEFKVYGDGVYVSDKPLGPFAYMLNSPFSYKPGGFVNGAGHGCTFQDKYGNYWHVATMTISIRHMFERRIGVFPAFFDDAGQLNCITAFGDYPMGMPTKKMDFQKESLFKGWMLLSYKKNISASSSLLLHTPGLACDEDVRTWWSAASTKSGEWLQIDLKTSSQIHAIQINFADEGAKLRAGDTVKSYKYIITASKDGTHWSTIIDRSSSNIDVVHDYQVLLRPMTARYIKIVGLAVPDGYFSISDLRVFGIGAGKTPAPVKAVTVNREVADTRKATLKWESVKGATGYSVSFGISKDKLYHSILVYGDHSLTISGLNKDIPYFFRIDSFNENGITKGQQVYDGKPKN